MWTLTDDIHVHVALLGAGGEQLEGGGLAGVEVPHRLPHELALLRRALVAENILDVGNISDAENIYLPGELGRGGGGGGVVVSRGVRMGARHLAASATNLDL